MHVYLLLILKLHSTLFYKQCVYMIIRNNTDSFFLYFVISTQVNMLISANDGTDGARGRVTSLQ